MACELLINAESRRCLRIFELAGKKFRFVDYQVVQAILQVSVRLFAAVLSSNEWKHGYRKNSLYGLIFSKKYYN